MSEGETNPGFVPDLSVGIVEVKDINGDLAINKTDNFLGNGAKITGELNDGEKPAAEDSVQKWNFNRRQWTFILIFGVTNIFRAVSILITGPFYPPEAKDRGISDTKIGFVMGSYDFATFAVVLLFGKFIIPKFGPRVVLKLSILNLSVCMVLFGCLDLTENATVFLTFSFLIRILAGAGDAGFYPSAFTIFAQEFEGNVSTAIGLFEFLFGLGAILGPIIFGSFIDFTGFLSVYVIVGFLLLCCVGLNHFCVPGPVVPYGGKNASSVVEAPEEAVPAPVIVVAKPIKSKKWFELFFIPSILVVIFNLFTTAVSIGFFTATLETHLEQFNLTTFETSVVFIVSNTIYMLTTPAWGKIGDMLKGRWRYLIIFIGAGLILVGFCVLGPLPFLHDRSTLWTTLIGLTLHGMGIGGAVMSAFPHATDSAIASGFSETEKTFSLIGSVYIMTFTLGNAVGPSLSGLLVDQVQFQNATLLVVGLSTLVLTSTFVLVLFQQGRKKQR